MDKLRVRSAGSRGPAYIHIDTRDCLSLVFMFLTQSPPRKVTLHSTEAPCIVFSDWAVEGGVASCGAVIFSARARGPCYFGLKVPEALVQEWSELGSSHCVMPAELLPILLIRCAVRELLHEAKVIYFIDNKGVHKVPSV
eukprot:1895026-Amphidinium_carterae.3